MTQLIEIVISPEGQTKLETKGFAGGSCREASRSIEEALGSRLAETTTAEFHSAADISAREHLKPGS